MTTTVVYIVITTFLVIKDGKTSGLDLNKPIHDINALNHLKSLVQIKKLINTDNTFSPATHRITRQGSQKKIVSNSKSKAEPLNSRDLDILVAREIAREKEVQNQVRLALKKRDELRNRLAYYRPKKMYKPFPYEHSLGLSDPEKFYQMVRRDELIKREQRLRDESLRKNRLNLLDKKLHPTYDRTYDYSNHDRIPLRRRDPILILEQIPVFHPPVPEQLPHTPPNLQTFYNVLPYYRTGQSYSNPYEEIQHSVYIRMDDSSQSTEYTPNGINPPITTLQNPLALLELDCNSGQEGFILSPCHTVLQHSGIALPGIDMTNLPIGITSILSKDLNQGLEFRLSELPQMAFLSKSDEGEPLQLPEPRKKSLLQNIQATSAPDKIYTEMPLQESVGNYQEKTENAKNESAASQMQKVTVVYKQEEPRSKIIEYTKEVLENVPFDETVITT